MKRFVLALVILLVACLGIWLMIKISHDKQQAKIEHEKQLVEYQKWRTVENKVRTSFTTTETDLLTGNLAFACDLFQQLRTDNSGNLVFSPYSISLAMAAAYAGARGDTAKQMAKVMHFNPPQSDLPAAFKTLTFRTLAPNQFDTWHGVKIEISNDMWFSPGTSSSPKPEAVKYLADNYNVNIIKDIQLFDDPNSSHRDINATTQRRTHGLINDPLPSDPKQGPGMVFVNSIYFKGNWQYKLLTKNTKPGPFHLLSGATIQVPMMHLTSESLHYAVNTGAYQALALPYKDGLTRMIIILPDPGRLAQVEASLTPSEITDLIDHLDNAASLPETHLTMPRFSFETDSALKPALMKLGMTLPFTGGYVADFSGLDATRTFYLYYVQHNAHIILDETGTEAAVSTGYEGSFADFTDTVPPKVDFVIDRPFLFLICRDYKDINRQQDALETAPPNEILFLGRVTDPRQK
jgi:serpin B